MVAAFGKPSQKIEIEEVNHTSKQIKHNQQYSESYHELDIAVKTEIVVHSGVMAIAMDRIKVSGHGNERHDRRNTEHLNNGNDNGKEQQAPKKLFVPSRQEHA